MTFAVSTTNTYTYSPRVNAHLMTQVAILAVVGVSGINPAQIGLVLTYTSTLYPVGTSIVTLTVNQLPLHNSAAW